MSRYCKLGINIDHVATLRNARGENHPDVLRAAKIVEQAGADIITMHLREDRRHIVDADLFDIKNNINLPINLEIAPTMEMIDIAISLNPESICLVPEKRQEITTEGGLDINSNIKNLNLISEKISKTDIKLSCFIDSDHRQIDLLDNLGIKIIEFHTGQYALSNNDKDRDFYLNKLKKAVNYSSNLGFTCNAGHGLNFENVKKIASIIKIQELNIGHFLMGESIFYGLEYVIKKMRNLIDMART